MQLSFLFFYGHGFCPVASATGRKPHPFFIIKFIPSFDHEVLPKSLTRLENENHYLMKKKKKFLNVKYYYTIYFAASYKEKIMS